MIFDDEVEEVCCLFLDRRIEVCGIKSCHNIREDSNEALILLISEEIIGF